MNYNELPKERLIEIITAYSEGPYADIYRVGMKQMSEIARQFEKEKIDVKSDDGDKLFSNFLAYMEKSKRIADSLEEIQKKIDPTVAAKIKSETIKPRQFSPEELATKNK
jgi:uncharacterized protein (DUF885 family)